MKQTAVQFLYDQIWKTPITEWGKLLHQAQQMEKQQIIDAYHINPLESKWENIGEQYYNETFNTKEK